MGYIRHHVIVVTCSGYEEAHNFLADVRQHAVRIGAAVTEIRASILNDHRSICIMPDGSKEGWRDSEVGDAQRAAVIDRCNSFRYEDGSSPLSWVEVEYGDGGAAVIVNDSHGAPAADADTTTTGGTT